MTDKKLILGMALHDGSGALNNAWRAPQVDPGNYADFEANIRYAQAAERGKFAFLFIPDFPAVRGDIEHRGVRNIIDPMIALTAISQATSRIGFVATGSTTFQEPFNHARQFKALDVLSHGRAGWNAVTTSDPAVAANYGKPVAGRTSPSRSFRHCGAAGRKTPGSRTRPRVSTSTARSCDRSICRVRTSPHAAPWQYHPRNRASR
jgi:hypothetical protein